MSEPCCGCEVESDYGTGTINGDGSVANPYTLQQIDPTFKRPVVRASRTTNQSIPNSTITPIQFTTEDFDTHAMWVVGSPSVFTIAIAGLYLFGINVAWQSSANAVREVYFRQNGSIELQRNSCFKSDTVVSQQSYDITYQWYFAAGDTLEAVAFQTSGGPLNIGTPRTAMWMMYLGQKI